MSGRQFNADIRAWAKKANANLDALARQTAQEVAAQVVQKTPVDTGFLRGSWQPSIGAPTDAVGSADPSGATAQSQVTLVAAQFNRGERFFMINNAAYARFVEYGTSKMAGRYFVNDTVADWQAIVRRVARSIAK